MGQNGDTIQPQIIIILLIATVLLIILLYAMFGIVGESSSNLQSANSYQPSSTSISINEAFSPTIDPTAVESKLVTTVASQQITPSPLQDIDSQVETWLSTMSLEQKVGQMLMVGMPSSTLDPVTIGRIEQLGIGGIIFLEHNTTSPQQVYDLTTSIQSNASIPLFISWNQEGGTVYRDRAGITRFPSSMGLGQLNEPAILMDIGKTIGAEMSSLGVNMNFAPVLDINNNPQNPVIGLRSFGEVPEQVTRLGTSYIQGQQAAGVIAVAKHFPGHGDVWVDSHIDLPLLDKSEEALYSNELIPFAAALETNVNVGGVMVGHLKIPDLDELYPASLSRSIVTDLLRQNMAYDGLIMTDDLGMGAIVNYYAIQEAAVLAILAGNDMILTVETSSYPELIHQAIVSAIQAGQISQVQIDQSVRRILRVKAQYNLSQVPSKDILPDASINQEFADQLGQKIVQSQGESIIHISPADHPYLLLIVPTTIPAGQFVGDNISFLNELFSSCGFTILEYFYDPQWPADVNHQQKLAMDILGQFDAAIVITKDSYQREKLWNDRSQIELVAQLSSIDKQLYVIVGYSPYDEEQFPNIENLLKTFGDTEGQIKGIVNTISPSCQV